MRSFFCFSSSAAAINSVPLSPSSWHRFNPHAKPPKREPFETIPASSLNDLQFFDAGSSAQLLTPFDASSTYRPFAGYYNNPSYVTLSPVIFTTQQSLLNTKDEDVEPYTYYFVGTKLWYIPLYFMFAFVVFYAYMIIRNATVRKTYVTTARWQQPDEIAAVMENVQKAFELYNNTRDCRRKCGRYRRVSATK